MPEFLKILALTVVLLFAQELFRRGGRWPCWIAFGLLPLALAPYWLTANDFDWFLLLKTGTICFCVCWGTAVRFTSLRAQSLARRSIPALLVLNILEAVAVDVLAGGAAHGMVAAAGLLLIAAVPLGDHAVRIDSPKRHRDFRHAVGRGWVIGYTLWNWAFVLLNYPQLLGHHTAVLAAALIAGLIDPHRWLQSRACTLGLNLITMATINTEMVAWLDTSNLYDQRFANAMAGFAAAFAVGYVAWAWLISQPNPRSTSTRSTLGVPPADSQTFAA